MVDLDEYLAVLPGSKISDKSCVTEINEKKLNSILNSWINQSCVQRVDCESINFKADVNMFELVEISQSIYEGAVEISYKTYWVRYQPYWSQKED